MYFKMMKNLWRLLHSENKVSFFSDRSPIWPQDEVLIFQVVNKNCESFICEISFVPNTPSFKPIYIIINRHHYLTDDNFLLVLQFRNLSLFTLFRYIWKVLAEQRIIVCWIQLFFLYVPIYYVWHLIKTHTTLYNNNPMFLVK